MRCELAWTNANWFFRWTSGASQAAAKRLLREGGGMERRAAIEAGLAQVVGLPALGFGFRAHDLLRTLTLRRHRAVRRSSATVRRRTGALSSRAPAARGYLRLRWPPFRRSWSRHLRPQVGAPPRGVRAKYVICFGRDALILCSLVCRRLGPRRAPSPHGAPHGPPAVQSRQLVVREHEKGPRRGAPAHRSVGR